MTRTYTSWGWTDDEIDMVNIQGTVCRPPVTGVVSNNRISDFLSDALYLDDAIDLGVEEFIKEHEDEPEYLHDDALAEVSGGPYLIGDWQKEKDGTYSPNREGPDGYAAIVGEINTQVVWSKRTNACVPCSPRYPGQADLDARDGELGVLAFDMPDESCYDEEVSIAQGS